MKRFFAIFQATVISVLISIIAVPPSLALNIYLRPTEASLSTIAGMSSGDQAIVGTSGGTTSFYYYNGANWVKSGVDAAGLSGTSITIAGSGEQLIGTPDRESNDSFFAITGTFGDNTSGDNRALGITTNIITNPVGGARSSEGINVRPSFTLPSSGGMASIEGVHIDFSGAWGPWAGQSGSTGVNDLWQRSPDNPTSATVGAVYAIRVRGVTIPDGVTGTVAAIKIDADFNGPSGIPTYNIFSNGATARNRFDGILEVYGSQGHIIGGPNTALSYAGLMVTPTVTDNTGGVYGAVGLWYGWGGSVSPPATRPGYGIRSSPTFAEAASGAHPYLVGVQFDSPTITPGAATTDFVATARISGTPAGGTYGNYSLWIDDGSVRWDGGVALGGGAAPTLGTIGGSGPTGAAQIGWLPVYIDAWNTISYIPYWQ